MKGINHQIAQSTRFYRKLHRWIAIPLLMFFFLVGATGLLLGLKQTIGILPETQKGVSSTPETWLSIAEISQVARDYSTQTLKASATIDRIDIRPKKGIAKIVFSDHFTELQIDCTTGKVLSVSTRTSDIIEKIHDGSILDRFVGTQNDPIKIVYTFSLALGLMLLSVSGFWLWYNPKRIKRSKNQESAL